MEIGANKIHGIVKYMSIYGINYKRVIMTQNEKRGEDQRLLVLSPEGEALITQTIDQIFDADLEEALPLIKHIYDSADPQAIGTAFKTYEIVLKSLWDYFEAMKFIRTEGNFVEAVNLFKSAADGFKQGGQGKLMNLSVGLGVYAEAVTEVHKYNVGQALELLKKNREYLWKAGKFGSIFEPFIDQMKPEIFFLSGAEALLNLDHANAKTLIDQASLAAEQVAYKYYTEGEPDYYTFLGSAHFYKAFYTFFQAIIEFNYFDYDALTNENDLTLDAVLAVDFWDKADIENVIIRNASYLSEAFVQLLELIGELAFIMQRVFYSTFKPDFAIFAHLKQKVHTAKDLVSKAGPEATVIVRYCDQLSIQVNNLERLINQRIMKILDEIREKAEVAYQESKGTPTEEIASVVKQAVENWGISDQEQMIQNVDNLTFSLKTKIPDNQANKHIYDKIEGIKKEKDLVKQYKLMAILIASIPQIVIGGNMTGDIVNGDKIKIENVQGDVIGVGVKGKGNIIAKEVSGTINLNFKEHNKMPDEYSKSLEAFSQEVNAQLKKHNISQEKTVPIQESINELVKEVEGIKPEEKIDIEQKENIKGKITKVIIRLLKILPDGAETVATFTPLAPFSKIIGKGIEEIAKAIQTEI